MTDVIAVDLGNESGRAYNVRFDGKHAEATELYRFANTPVTAGGVLYWDALRLWHEVETGLERALQMPVSSIGVDSFGVDFGLLDGRGRLIGSPVHMRDGRADGMLARALTRITRDDLYRRTGIGFYVINTLYQLMAVADQDFWQLEVAHSLLTMPNLINFWLTGARVNEFTHSTTTQMYNPTLRDWDGELLETLGLPTHFLPNVVPPGKAIGKYHDVPVHTVGSHDTASAVVAVPATSPDFAYISSGTWSLMGVETDAPLLSAEAMAANISNEGGAFGTFRPLKNVMGLWILQGCRAAWAAQDPAYGDYARLMAEAEAAPPFGALIDPDDPMFFAPGDMPGRIREFCARAGQTAPQTVGQTVRCVLESLALKYRHVLEQLEGLVRPLGRAINVLHIVGGGAQNPLLCQMTADAIKRPVLAGPAEATALGNGLVQLYALGEIGGLAEARAVVRASYPPAPYEPTFFHDWDAAYGRFRGLITTP
jgi:rhamnulokinase